MGATSETRVYNTRAAIALDKLSDRIADAVSTGVPALDLIRRKGNWKGVSSGGYKRKVPLMHTLITLQPIGSYGTVNVNPTDGITAAFFDWVQTAVPIIYSDFEEFQTSGPEAIASIVEAQYKQATASLDEFIGKSILRGQAVNDTTSIASAQQNAADGSYFVEPFGKLIKFDPTTATTIGGIDQSANPWWQNQTKTSAATTLAGFLNELRALYILTGKGGGGQFRFPDFHIADLGSTEVYEKALAAAHQNPSYERGDIPYANVAFKTKPVVGDEFVPDVYSGSTTITYGSWYMGNSNNLFFEYDKVKSFKQDERVRPYNQLASVSLMPVRGCLFTDNRRKLGVLGKIPLATLRAI